MKAPHCKTCGRFMVYKGRWMLGYSTGLLGLFLCGDGHGDGLFPDCEVYVLPWDFRKA